MNDATILEARALAFLEQPRSASSKPWHLPDDSFCDAVKLELEGVPWRVISQQLVANGLPEGKLPGRSAWSSFWSEFTPFLRVARRRSAASGANQLVEEIKTTDVAFDKATLDLVRQTAFELADSPSPDSKAVKSLVMVLLKHDEQQLRREAMELDRQKYTDAQKSKIDAGLEALRVEIASNPKAMKAYETLRQTLAATE